MSQRRTLAGAGRAPADTAAVDTPAAAATALIGQTIAAVFRLAPPGAASPAAMPVLR